MSLFHTHPQHHKRGRPTITEQDLVKCDRCREKTGNVVRTIVTIESAHVGDAQLILEICDDCYSSLRLWIYGANVNG